MTTQKKNILNEFITLIRLSKSYNTLLIGIYFMIAGTIVDMLQHIFSIGLPLFRYFFYISSTLFFIIGVIKNRKKDYQNSLLCFIIYAFIIWTIMVFLRGIPKLQDSSENYYFLKNFLTLDIYFFVIPLLLLVEPNLYLIKRIMDVSVKLALIGCILVPFVFILYKFNPLFGVENLSRIFSASGSLIVLTLIYHRQKTRQIVILSILLSLIFLILLGRRNMIIYFISVLSIGTLLNLFNKYKEKSKSIITLSLIFIFIFIVYLIFEDMFQFTLQRFGTGFDSRETVFTEFFYDFDKKPIDWIFGRGLFGEYFSDSTAMNKDENVRYGIENGYLNHILLGGWVYLGLLIILSLIAVFLGYFRSNNILSKALASIIIVYFIDMVGFGLPAPHLKYLMVFVSIAGCYSKPLRMLKDVELIKVLRT